MSQFCLAASSGSMSTNPLPAGGWREMGVLRLGLSCPFEAGFLPFSSTAKSSLSAAADQDVSDSMVTAAHIL